MSDRPAPNGEPASSVVDAEALGPRCEKCGHPSEATACPACGWYASLGVHVEVDQNFEAVIEARRSAQAAGDQPQESPANESVAEWRKHLEVWQDVIPMWGWGMIGTTLAVFAAAILIRVGTAASPALHTYCGVAGLVAGLLLVFLAHLVAFVLCSFDDASVGLADLIVKPFNSWKRIASELPRRLWLANGANLGASSALAAAVIIGGIPYERLLDWGFKQPPKKNMIAAIAQMAAKEGREVNDLNDAIRELGRQAGVDKLKEAATGKPVQHASEPRQKMEALIFGYRVDAEGRLTEVLVAAERQGKMKYAGRLRPDLDDQEAAELVESFRDHPASRPFVPTSASGIWLRPRFTCRVSFTSWPNGMRPQKIAWDALLGEIEI